MNSFKEINNNKDFIQKSEFEKLIDQNIWNKIYENFINDYEEFDPDYEYECQEQLQAFFFECKYCFTWVILNCSKCLPIRIKDLKSNILKLINFLDENNDHYHDYDLEHDIYGMIDYIIEEFRNYFRILTDKELENYLINLMMNYVF